MGPKGDIIMRIFVTGRQDLSVRRWFPELIQAGLQVLGLTLSEAGLFIISRVTVGVDIIC